jgi:hypothetical protein
MALLLTATAVAAAVLGGALASQLLDEEGTPATTEQGDGGEGQSRSDGRVVESPGGSEDGSESDSESSSESDPESGDGGGEDSAYTLLNSEVELDIVAPVFLHDTEVVNDRCAYGNSTSVDLDDLTVDDLQPTVLGPAEEDEFKYAYCDHPGILGKGIEFNNQVFAGLVDDPNVTPEECYEAAHTPTLPNLIPIEDIWADETLHADMGICFETSEDNVVLLWFDEASADPHNEDLRTYLTTATQWAPSPNP